MIGQRTNWAGNVSYAARRLHRPSSVAELQEIVAGSDRIRVLGTGHTFNRLADTSGDQVSVAGLPPVVTVDRVRATVSVPAGMRYGELVTGLHGAGWALHNLASLPHISIAGACATGTHGSGDRSGSLAAAVTGLELVRADGELVAVDRLTDPQRFPGTVVALGGLGVVTRLTLRVVPAFDVRQEVYDDLPLADFRRHWAEIFGSGYSVSLFTDWSGARINQVWIKHRVDEPVDRPLDGWTGAKPAGGPRHPVPGMSPEHCTEQLGAPGPWHARLPHFRLEFTPSSGAELQSEYLVPRSAAVEAFDALDAIRDRLAPVVQISEVRTVAADDLWLSPAYRRDAVAFHFTWIADADAVTPVVAAVERQLAPYEPRPHWGKLFAAAPEQLAAGYPRHADFTALLGDFDPTGKFRNELLDRYFPDR